MYVNQISELQVTEIHSDVVINQLTTLIEHNIIYKYFTQDAVNPEF